MIASKAKDQRRAIHAASLVIEEVFNHYPRMEIGQLRVLLRVLEKPGIRASDLLTLTGMTKSSLSRAVRVLGSGPYTYDGTGETKQGLNLLTQVTDPLDARAKLIAPTRLGRRLGEEIAKIIGEANGKTTG